MAPPPRPVRQAVDGAKTGSVAIHRVGNYKAEYALVDLSKVAGKTKVMDDSFISPAGNDVTPAFLDYVRPLLGSDLPKPARLEGPAVARASKDG